MSDPAYCLLGARAIQEKIAAIRQEIAGVRQSEDIECLHRMRVATRRLRSALSIFQECLTGKDYRKWRKNIRKMTRSLGETRDVDVQIEFLESHLEKLDKKLIPGTKRVLLRLKQKRQSFQAEVEKALDQMERRKILEEMEEAACGMVSEAMLQNAEEPNAYVFSNIEKMIHPLLEDLLSFEPYVSQAQESVKLHEMRIAAKRLRYALEIFEPLYENEMTEARQAAKKVQSLLGDLHDCDVWAGLVQEFLASEKERMIEFFGHARGFRRLKPGIIALGEDRRVMREKVYGEFAEYWHKSREKKIWQNLKEALQEQVTA